jgi:serine/alanine adding enzyme
MNPAPARRDLVSADPARQRAPLVVTTARRTSRPVVRLIAEPGDSWRRLATEVDGSRLAHAPEWFSVIRRAYGHEPLYLMAEHGDAAGVLPAFVVRRPFFGTIVTSMPFLDSGGPCSTSPAIGRALVDRLLTEARVLGARAVDLRTPLRLPIDARSVASKVNMALSLEADPDQMWRRLDKDTRYQVRKARQSGLSVQVGGAEQLDAFYPIFAARMRDLGSPVHDRTFFKETVDAFEGRSWIVLVRKGDTVIGGLVAIAFRDRVVVPWAACLKEHFRFCPNMLLYWETIRAACAEGFARFDFGRSTLRSGTYRFKAQWGAREEPLFWYTIPLAGQPDSAAAPATGRGGALMANLWRRLPLPITRRIGPRIRRYLIQ